LKSIPGIGNAASLALFDKFGSLESVFSASATDLAATPGISKKTAGAIAGYKGWETIKRSLEAIDKANISVVTVEDKLYPENLINVYDRPAVLYVRGKLQKGDITVAIVGSRIATTHGKYTTERISRELTQRGITIVSGMARGIDSAAHRGALAARGRTVAVLGCGLDVIYPPENEKLFSNIIENGAVISEFPPGTPPLASNFPSRNRIISGMSYGVVVVEASEKSGSLITARLALEQGREVFAVPGSVEAATSRGTNKLIKQGAKLIENADDVLEEILPQLEKTTLLKNFQADDEQKPHADIKENLNDAEAQLFSLITDNQIHVDDLILAAGLSPAETLGSLMSLELKGLITQHPGKLFSQKQAGK